MNDLQQKKLERLFGILDYKQNGTLERADYEAIAGHVAALRGLAVGSPEYAQMVARMGTYWDALAQRADKNVDGSVTRSEWTQSMMAGSESMQQTRAQMVGLAAVFLDRDGDGQITSGDYQRLLEMVGHKLADADAIFQHLDFNGDGKIDTSELATLVDQFLFSNDPDAPGNWLLGQLS